MVPVRSENSLQDLWLHDKHLHNAENVHIEFENMHGNSNTETWKKQTKEKDNIISISLQTNNSSRDV